MLFIKTLKQFFGPCVVLAGVVVASNSYATEPQKKTQSEQYDPVFSLSVPDGYELIDYDAVTEDGRRMYYITSEHLAESEKSLNYTFQSGRMFYLGFHIEQSDLKKNGYAEVIFSPDGFGLNMDYSTEVKNLILNSLKKGNVISDYFLDLNGAMRVKPNLSLDNVWQRRGEKYIYYEPIFKWGGVVDGSLDYYKDASYEHEGSCRLVKGFIARVRLLSADTSDKGPFRLAHIMNCHVGGLTKFHRFTFISKITD